MTDKTQNIIKAYRTAHKLTLREQGEKMSVSYQTIKNWEDGVNEPGSGYLFELYSNAETEFSIRNLARNILYIKHPLLVIRSLGGTL